MQNSSHFLFGFFWRQKYSLTVSNSIFSNNNDWNIYFDYTGINVTNNTIFQITVDKTDTYGKKSVIKQYFNTNLSTDKLNGWVAVIVTFFLVVFGLSFTSTNKTFSWFGIFIVLLNFFILGQATQEWYVIFMETINGIALVYLILITLVQGYGGLN